MGGKVVEEKAEQGEQGGEPPGEVHIHRGDSAVVGESDVFEEGGDQ